jgi:mannitol-1-phosphate 5-dehydrogenase
MARALIIGGGAIGRGFVPWVLDKFEIDILDTSSELVNGIEERRGFHSYMSDGERLQEKWVKLSNIATTFERLQPLDYDIAFISVGPRNATRLPPGIGKLKCPIFSLENDPITVDQIKEAYGLKEVYFGVPDVITSSTASPENLARDPYSIHTENGVLYLQRPLELDPSLEDNLPDVSWLPVERLNQEWDAKLYIHNTPHCIAAYLGHMAGCTYVHEALANPTIKRIINGVIGELLSALKIMTPHDHDFIERYAEKEALSILLSTGINPTYLMAGIASALYYGDKADDDYSKLSELEEFGVPAFLKFHLGIDEKSIESMYVANNFADAIQFLKREII